MRRGDEWKWVRWIRGIVSTRDRNCCKAVSVVTEASAHLTTALFILCSQAVGVPPCMLSLVYTPG